MELLIDLLIRMFVSTDFVLWDVVTVERGLGHGEDVTGVLTSTWKEIKFGLKMNRGASFLLLQWIVGNEAGQVQLALKLNINKSLVLSAESSFYGWTSKWLDKSFDNIIDQNKLIVSPWK